MDKKYGLCLAGGGGKGSYQIGAIKALKSLGIDTKIKAVSGASIGGLNALFFASMSMDEAESLWKQVNNLDYLDIDPVSGYCDRSKLIERLRTKPDYERLKYSGIDCYVCTAVVANSPVASTRSLGFREDIKAYNLFDEMVSDAEKSGLEMESRYTRINDMDRESIIQYMLATSSIPLVYAPVVINNEKHIDGGFKDNCPIRPLIDEAECTDLIIIKLGKSTEYDLYLASRAESIIEIVPSASIGDTILSGTLDFSPDKVEYRMQLGYYDTLRAFDAARRRAEGNPYSKAEMMLKEQKDLEIVKQQTSAKKSVEKFESSMKDFNNLLGKYGIDLK